jgi:NADH/F420H2 dehydrogenase subunit C
MKNTDKPRTDHAQASGLTSEAKQGAVEPPKNDLQGNSLASAVLAILGPEAKLEAAGSEITFRVPATQLHDFGQRLKDAGWDFLVFVTAVDFPDQDAFELVYEISNYKDAQHFCLVTNIPRNEPVIRTVSDIWRTAEWHEREVYDLFGIRFDSHPDLRRILLDDTWKGYPLRKDYKDELHEMIRRPGS